MCGIAGVARADGQAADKVVLTRMAGAMRHRGPDESGTFATDGVGLAQRRLSIVDIEGGSPPIHGRHCAVLVANGEIYNAPELRQGLGDPNLCKSLSDCEPPVHLFEHEGPTYADKFRGMYAVAITDRSGQRLTLSRDPFGINPLCYVEDTKGFAFASEPKALVAKAWTSDSRPQDGKGVFTVMSNRGFERFLDRSGLARSAPMWATAMSWRRRAQAASTLAARHCSTRRFRTP